MANLDKAAADQVRQTSADQSSDAPASLGGSQKYDAAIPAAGAHAAGHLTNEDATPGSGALTSRAHASGKEVDGGAG